MKAKCPHCLSDDGFEHTFIEIDSVFGYVPNYHAIVCKTCNVIITVIQDTPQIKDIQNN